MKIILGLLCVSFFGVLGLEPARAEDQARAFLGRIRAIRPTSSSTDIKQLIADLEKFWHDSKDDNYHFLMLELCSAISSSTGPDASRARMVRSLAAEALDTPGEKPLVFEVKMVMFLQSDPDYADGSLRENEWSKQRLARAVRWLRTWDHLQKAEAALPKGLTPPPLTVEPPSGARILPGMPAKMIKDPVLRKRYEDDLVKHAEQHRQFRLKDDLERYRELFIAPATQYLTEAYTKPPYHTSELEQLLSSFALEKATRIAILNAVKKRIAEQSATTNPVKVPASDAIRHPPQATQPSLEMPVVLKADPRLQVKISADFREPTLPQILSVLSSRTTVPMSTDRSGQEKAVYSSLNWNAVEAWMVMEQIAQVQAVDGRWEQAGNGYRLVRNASSTKTQEPNRLPESKPEIAQNETATPSSSTSRAKVLIAVNLVIFAVIATGLLVRYLKRRTP